VKIFGLSFVGAQAEMGRWSVVQASTYKVSRAGRSGQVLATTGGRAFTAWRRRSREPAR